MQRENLSTCLSRRLCDFIEPVGPWRLTAAEECGRRGKKGIFQTWVIILSDSVITRKAKEERCIFIIYETARLSASRSDISHAEYIPCSTGHTFSEWSHLSCWIWHKVQVIDFQRLGLVGGIYRCHQRSSHCSTFIASLTYWNFFWTVWKINEETSVITERLRSHKPNELFAKF